MESDEYKYLQEISDISSKVIEKLNSKVQSTKSQSNVAEDVKFDGISSDFDLSNRSFRQLHISVDLADALSGMFTQEVEKFQKQFVRDIVKFRKEYLEWGGQEKHLSKFCAIAHLRFNKAVENVHKEMISTVKAEIKRFHRDAAETDMESASESDTVHKGHSRFAVAILEKVFSQTMNITRAEKFQLAKATKLEPRQVTIWFQNRRNRKNFVSQADGSLNNHARAQASNPINKKRKYDGMEEEPRTPTQRRRLSQNEIMSSSGSTVFTYGTPLSATSSVSIDSDLFENKPSSSNNRCISGSSTTTSYDDGSCSFQGSKFGNTSFDDQIQKLAGAYGFDNSNEDNMMFNKDGQTLLDIDDLQLSLSAFEEELSQSKSLKIDFTLTTPSAMESTQPNTPQFKVSLEDLSEEALMQHARQLLECEFHALEEMRQINKEESWSAETMDKIFLVGNDISNPLSSGVEELAFIDICSSQESSQNGTSQVCTPKSGFDFSIEGLGLDEIAENNYESITEKKDSIDILTPFSQATFDFASPKMLCSSYTPTKASSE